MMLDQEALFDAMRTYCDVADSDVPCRFPGCGCDKGPDGDIDVARLTTFVTTYMQSLVAKGRAGEVVERLNAQADEIASAGHSGWGNTMREAARILAALSAQSPPREATVARVIDAATTNAREFVRKVLVEHFHQPTSEETINAVAAKVLKALPAPGQSDG